MDIGYVTARHLACCGAKASMAPVRRKSGTYDGRPEISGNKKLFSVAIHIIEVGGNDSNGIGTQAMTL